MGGGLCVGSWGQTCRCIHTVDTWFLWCLVLSRNSRGKKNQVAVQFRRVHVCEFFFFFSSQLFFVKEGKEGKRQG